MGTRSAIGYLEPSGSVRAVYCHWDGYPEHQLPILEKHYSSTDKVKDLIRPGSMSSLRTRNTWETYSSPLMKDENGDIALDEEGNLRKDGDREPQPLYHHERGDEDPPHSSDFPLNYWFHSRDCEYLYVFDGKKWITYSADYPG